MMIVADINQGGRLLQNITLQQKRDWSFKINKSLNWNKKIKN